MNVAAHHDGALPQRRVAWVTGTAGFIGGHVAAAFQRQDWDVVGLGHRCSPSSRIPHSFETGIDAEGLGRALTVFGRPNVIFHAAGAGTVGRSLADPAQCFRDTVGTTQAILDFVKAQAPQCRIIFPSSAAVYGAAENVALGEDHALNPISSYGRHKVAAEALCREAADQDGLSIAIIRLFSVYGPGLRKQLPWELGNKLLARLPHIDLFGTGQETRDFIAVDDVANLAVFLATTPITAPLIVNGGTGIATTVSDFAQLLAMVLGVQTTITFTGEQKPGDPHYYRADVGRLHALGFVPKIGLLEGLNLYTGWLRSVIA